MQIIKKSTYTLAMMAGFFLSASLWAADTDPSAQMQQVLSDLHQSNEAEIRMGRMAKEKGASEEVRSYGDRLMKDHREADAQVQDLAKKDGVTLAAPASPEMKTDLSQKTGMEFDRAFANVMVEEHKENIAKLEQAERALPQSEVRDLITRILPKLQQHLRIAQQIQKSD